MVSCVLPLEAEGVESTGSHALIVNADLKIHRGFPADSAPVITRAYARSSQEAGLHERISSSHQATTESAVPHATKGVQSKLPACRK